MVDKSTTAKHLWCLHCERAFETASVSPDEFDTYDECGYSDCDGGAFDLREWSLEDWPRNANPDYPEIPIFGEFYRLYGK